MARWKDGPHLLGNHLDWSEDPYRGRLELEPGEVALRLHWPRDHRQRRPLAQADLKSKMTAVVPVVTLGDVPAEGGVVVGFVVLVEGERDPVVGPVEHLNQAHEDVVLGQLAREREVEVFGEPPRRAEHDLAQSGPALESEVIHCRLYSPR